MGSRILVATDGTEGSLGALRWARGFQRRDGGQVLVITTLEPTWPYNIDPDALLAGPEVAVTRELKERLLRSVQQQIREVGADPGNWIVHYEFGPPAPAIVRYAEESRADHILLGIGKHAPADRWLGGETAVKVARLAHVPMLAVQPEALELPQRVLVGFDLSEYSHRAARFAAELLGGAGELHLAFVSDEARGPYDWEATIDWVTEAKRGALAQQDALARELAAESGVVPRTWHLEGDPARELLALSDRLNVDLLAAGSHGLGFFARLVLGSVSAKLLRGARCSVLIAPPSTLPAELETKSANSGRSITQRATR